MQDQINKIEIHSLRIKDYRELKTAMQSSYTTMPGSFWKESQIRKLIKIFSEGQIVIKVDGKIAGCALSIIIKNDSFDEVHTYRDITADYSFDTHSNHGDILYGIDVFVKPQFRGLRLGRRMYDYRKDLCEKLNLKGIAFGGRIPNYHKHSDELTPRQYIEKVKFREIHDPVLNFQLSNEFYVSRVLKNYLEGDKASNEYAVLLKWDNIYYQKPVHLSKVKNTDVRIGLVQWQMRSYKTVEDLMQQVEYFVDALSDYRSDFALFPEFFMGPLMADYNHLNGAEAIRHLAEYTALIKEQFARLSISYNINIISGSMPEIVDGELYNVGYLCKRDGKVERYEKIHVTPDESKVWGMKGGNQIKVFDTDSGRVGILICYDVEFPELCRLMALQGMEILFVPFLTDTQNGYSRVKQCAQARAIENECFVAIAGSVGNLPNVHNMDIHYAQSAVFTPSDFSFPINGVKSETTPNTEMILIADVNLDLLKELHNFGSVRNLKDRRTDLYQLKRLNQDIQD
jgi:predicted amidohydrolase/GNAT superfamily N-acetyltransferase